MDATRPWRIEGVVRRYAWGSPSAIPDLLGMEPDGGPQAELWLGAHPSAPSRVVLDDGEIGLDAWIRRDPEALLGPPVASRFGGDLPFLFKVLAADRALSIQAHPSRAQARAGFERENAAGLPLDAPHRSYRDPNHKPELVCALTPFRILSRFRDPGEIAPRIEDLAVAGLAPLVEALRRGDAREALAGFFAAWMTLERSRRTRLVEQVAEVAKGRIGDPVCAEVARLADLYPGDAGVLAPLFLNVVELAPGEATFLPAGELHSYLGGVAVELMANSDNVLRGGLTDKHVDVPELLATLRFEPGRPQILAPTPIGPARARYQTPAEEFRLDVLGLRAGITAELEPESGPRILLAVSGEACVSDGRDSLPLPRGRALFVPHSAARSRIEGDATVYVASVGDLDSAAERE